MPLEMMGLAKMCKERASDHCEAFYEDFSVRTGCMIYHKVDILRVFDLSEKPDATSSVATEKNFLMHKEHP